MFEGASWKLHPLSMAGTKNQTRLKRNRSLQKEERLYVERESGPQESKKQETNNSNAYT
jgi:hypothetical protein